MKFHRAEEIWLVIGVAILVISMVITGYQGFAKGMAPPSGTETIDPQKVSETKPFDEPGVYQVGDNQYEVIMVVQAFQFTPSNIELPKGADVTFKVTSKDVIHGFQVVGTNINAMITPGYIQTIHQKFDKPGEFLVICNEYCGAGHQLMSTTISVK